MPIEVKSFDDIEAVAADAGGALDRAAQRHLHDRLEWFRLAEAYRPSQGRARVWRADDGQGGRAWLFLSDRELPARDDSHALAVGSAH